MVYLENRERDHFTRIAANQGAVAVLNAYGSNVVTFNAQPLGPVFSELLPGIYVIAAYGHTPGHVVYMLSSGRERLFVAGDFLQRTTWITPQPLLPAGRSSITLQRTESQSQACI